MVIKCRDQVLRREALALLRRAPLQEGLWSRSIMVQVSERVIDLEEGSLGYIEQLPTDMQSTEVPESMRIKLVKIGLRTTAADGRSGDEVEFYTKPLGRTGPWSVYKEFFPCIRGSSESPHDPVLQGNNEAAGYTYLP